MFHWLYIAADQYLAEQPEVKQRLSFGFVAEGTLRDLAKKDFLPKKAKDEFYERVVKCIKTMFGKLKGRCPVDSEVVRNAVVFNPTTVMNCRESSLVKKLKCLLQHLVLVKLIPARIADTIIAKYSSMRDIVGTLDVTTLLVLDEFYFNIVKVQKIQGVIIFSQDYTQSLSCSG